MSQRRRPLVLAHRGGYDGQENSIDAINRALAAGADGVEIDFQIGGDGELVARHDLGAEPTTDDDVPRLGDVVAAVSSGGHSLLIDFKSREDPGAEAAAMAEALRAVDWPDQIMVSSFSVPFLEALAPLAPGVPLFPIVSLRQNFPRPPELERWDGASVLAGALVANPRLLSSLRRRGRLLVWFGLTEWSPMVRMVMRLGAAALIVGDVGRTVELVDGD